MMHDAQVNLSGYLASEPKWTKVAGDVSKAKLRVAYTARWRNRETGEWSDGATSFVNVVCWRQLADNVSVCLRKGEPVLVVGRLHIRRYQDREGNQRTATEVEATSVGHDMTRGVASFSRMRYGAGPIAAGRAVDAQGPDGDAAEESGLMAGVTEGAPGGGVVDERAVADFARQLDDSFGADAPPDDADALEDGQEPADMAVMGTVAEVAAGV